MIPQAQEFLAQHHDGVLATVDGQRPCLRVFQVMKLESNRLYFATSPRKAVYRQLQANPNVDFLVLHGDVSVRVAGVARFDVDEERQRWIYDNNAVLPRLYPSFDTLVYFSVEAEEMDYFDLRPTPPVVLHWDSATAETSVGFRGERFR